MLSILNSEKRKYFENIKKLEKFSNEENDYITIIVAETMKELEQISLWVGNKITIKDNFIIVTTNLTCEFILEAVSYTKYIVYLNSDRLEISMQEKIDQIRNKIEKEGV